MFKAMVLDADTLIPTIMPQAIKNVEILEGDGSVGTVKVIHFGVKHRVDAVDKENLTHTYTIIEGDVLSSGEIESITYHIKIVPTEEGGSICKNRSIYNTKGDAVISEDNIKAGMNPPGQSRLLKRLRLVFKAIEAYLQANPDY